MVSSFYAGKTILLSLAFLVVHFGSEFGSEAQPVAPLPQSEIDALEILFAAVPELSPDWPAPTNYDMICNHSQNVICHVVDSQYHIMSFEPHTNLQLHQGARLQGTIPKSVFGPHVTTVILSRNNMHGAIPESIVNATQLRHLDLRDNGLYGTIPQSITALSQLKILRLNSNYLDCPLPAGFNEWARATIRPDNCGLYMNNWGAAGETGICGVTQVSDRCKYYPTRVPLVKPVPNPTSSFSSDTIAIEVAGHSTYFFPKRNGQTVYEEFQYFDMSALHELESADRYAAMLFEHPLPPFGAAKNNETHPHIYVAQSILANGAIFTLEWNLKPPAQQGVLDFAKVSFRITNFTYANATQFVAMAFSVNMRSPHSKTKAPTCDYLDANAKISNSFNCSSDIATINLEFNILEGFSMSFNGPNVNQGFSYPMTGEVDGVPNALFAIFADMTYAFDGRHHVEIPSYDTSTTQNVELHANLYFNKFHKEFYFDPDIVLALLFDTGEVDTVAVALAVTFSIVGALLIAFIVIWFSPLRGKVMPFTNREHANSTEADSAGLWKRGAKPSN